MEQLNLLEEDFHLSELLSTRSAIQVLFALAGTFSLSLELLWTVGLEMETLFLHRMEMLGFHYGSVQLSRMGKGTT